MGRALHIGVMVAVAVHMVSGCCWDRAHAGGGPFDTQALAVEASCPCHRGSGGAGQSGDDASQRHGCHASQCVVTRPDSMDSLTMPVGHGCLNAVCVTPAISAPGGIHGADSSIGRLGLRIPLHLLNQVLLI